MVAPELGAVNNFHGSGSDEDGGNMPRGMGGADSAQKGHAASYQASQVFHMSQNMSLLAKINVGKFATVVSSNFLWVTVC